MGLLPSTQRGRCAGELFPPKTLNSTPPEPNQSLQLPTCSRSPCPLWPSRPLVAQVTFDSPTHLAGRAFPDRLAWWRNTRQLGHGTLVALWHEEQGDEPTLLFATIVDREDDKLAVRQGGRPRLGLK